MTTRAEIWAEARSWIGTPHEQQACRKGLGADCKGLIAGVLQHVGRSEGFSSWAKRGDYHGVDPDLLRRGLADLFDRADAMRVGDILLLRMHGKAQHLGFYGLGADGPRIIHSSARARTPGVISTSLPAALRLWPLDSIWTLRGLDER